MRAAKESATRAVVEQQRALGVPDPGGAAVEKFIAPILAKIDCTPTDESERDATSKSKEELLAELSEVERQEVGTYDVDPKTATLIPQAGAWTPPTWDQLPRKEQDRIKIARLLEHPKWQPQFLAAARICGRHNTLWRHCFDCGTRERKYIEIYERANREYNLYERARRIQVGGVAA